jgi:hypothetical protein
MASYNALLALSDFRYSGVDHSIQVDPQVNRDAFHLFFSVEGSWGTVGQRREEGRMSVFVQPAMGELILARLRFRPGFRPKSVSVRHGGAPIEATVQVENALVDVTFPALTIRPDLSLEVHLTAE